VKGVEVAIEEATEYPFRDRISLVVSPAAAVRFPLHLRIPGWTRDPEISVNGRRMEGARIEREWRPGDRVEIRLPMPVRTIPGFNGSVSVERGPLVFALRIGESWSRLKQTGPVTDWEVFPTSPWNYGLRVSSFEVKEAPLARQPFNSMDPPVLLQAKARRVPQWVIVDDSAAPPPLSPVKLAAKKGGEVDETVTLIPYGAARLRITSFPVLAPDPPQRRDH
jgi:hypothetical protein